MTRVLAEQARVAHASLVAGVGDAGPLLFGIGGAVGVGKTTTAGELAAALAADGLATAQVATDSFLFSNAVLAERGLLLRKGFPETFDRELATRQIKALGRLRAGDRDVELPVYSHASYDLVPGATQRVGWADVVIVEGIYALQAPIAGGLHVGVYLDAAEALLRSWFVERFLDLCGRAEADPDSFYRMFVDLDGDGRRRQAEAVWDNINGVNLREHIAPTRAHAHVVVEKGADHTAVSVRHQRPLLGP